MAWQEVFDSLVGGDWATASDEVKRAVHEKIAELVVGKQSSLRDALVRALEDDSIDEGEVAGLVLVAVEASLPTDLVDLAGLQTRLSDGKVSVDDLVDAAIAWVGSRVGKSTPAFELLRAARAGNLSTQNVEQALLDWLHRIGKDSLATDIKTAIAGAHSLTLRGVIQLAAAYLLNDKIDVSALTDTTNQGLSTALIAALNKLGASELANILQALVDGDATAAAKKALDALGVTVDEVWLKAALSGQFDDVVLKELADLLKRGISDLEDDDAKSLAQALLDLFNGKKRLLAPADEQAVLGFTPQRYALFVKVRRIVYAAMIGVQGGALVPTAAMARPHVFAAAAIQDTTALKALVPTKSDWPRFAQLIFLFAKAEIGSSVQVAPVTPLQIEVGALVHQVLTSLE